MEQDPRQPAKLRKRSKSRERQALSMSGGLGGQPANTSQPMAPTTNASSEDKKKSKFRLSNPFHSKEKDRDNAKKDPIETNEHNPKRDTTNTVDTNFDSAYGSSEPNTSANPSFASNPHRASGGEQWNPPPPAPVQPTATTTPPPQQSNLAPPPTHSLQNRSSHENISRETYRDVGTGNIVTTTTTVSNTRPSSLQPTLTWRLPTDYNYDDYHHWSGRNDNCRAAVW
jgi:hypothetical protein